MMRILLLTLALAAAAMAEFVEGNSFARPFDSVGRDGSRVIPGWRHGGHAEVLNRFVRLTTDRQSKRGWLWAQSALDSTEFSSTLTFRISGQGKKFFGDGVALWATQTPYYSDGDLHGFSEAFTGVGLVLDTFKNTDSKHPHRDVMLLWNDGSRSADDMLTDAVGCDSDFRYHEARADFTVTNSSRVRLSARGNHVSVKIDPKNSGEWVTCVEDAEIGLDADWVKSARLGVTATTGALADNHDVLELSTFSSLGAERTADEQAEAAASAKKPTGMNSARFNMMSDALDELAEEVETMHHHLEHQLAALRDGLQNTISKLQAKEDTSEDRIDHLEEALGDRVVQRLEDRIDELERTTRDNLDRTVLMRLTKLEKALDRKIDTSIAEGVVESSGWKMPFAVLLVVVGGAGFAAYRHWMYLKKSHLL